VSILTNVNIVHPVQILGVLRFIWHYIDVVWNSVTWPTQQKCWLYTQCAHNVISLCWFYSSKIL